MHDSSQAPSSAERFFRRWGEFVVRRRGLCLALSLAATAAFVVQIPLRLTVDTSLESVVDEDSPVRHTLDELRAEFGRDDVFMVLARGEVFTEPYLTRLAALHVELENIDVQLPRAEAQAAAGSGDSAEAGWEGGEDWGEDGWGEEAGGSVIDEVRSLINARDVRVVDDALELNDLMDPLPATARIAEL